jgi:hypothetical protein
MLSGMLQDHMSRNSREETARLGEQGMRKLSDSHPAMNLEALPLVRLSWQSCASGRALLFEQQPSSLAGNAGYDTTRFTDTPFGEDNGDTLLAVVSANLLSTWTPPSPVRRGAAGGPM